MPLPANAPVAATTTAESRPALVASRGTGGVDGRVDISQQARDRRPVVQIDHDRRGAAGLGDVRLGVVTDQRDHLVAVLLQFGQYVGSDESCRAGQCTFIAGASSLWVTEAGPVPGSPPGG